MSRIALISDVHANFTALQTSIKQLEVYEPDIWICLGDLVGYGPNPSECIELIREKNMLCVKGNHDAGVTGELSVRHFRNPNRKLIEMTRSLISQEQLKWLKSLPLVIKQDSWIAAHSSPVAPEAWKYVESAFTARDIIRECDEKLCFIGHTHKPAFVADRLGVNKFSEGINYLINPGSIGQSRDGDYRASFAFIDTSKWEYQNLRAEFDVEPVLTGLMRLGFSRGEAVHMMKLS